MNIFESMLLGFFQGLTEFLPISSSGHLVLLETLMDYKPSEFLFFDLLLHIATLLAVCVFYRKRLIQLGKDCIAYGVKQDRSPVVTETVRLVLALLLSTVVTGVLGIVFKDTLEQMRDQLGLVGVSFILTGLLLFGTKFRGEPGPDALPYPPNLWIFALVLGLAQAVAITPGISRSGTTVCVALLLGGGKEKSVEYSFLMSIPAILGATILEMKDAQIQIAAIPALAGFIAAMVSGLVFLWMLLWIVRKGKLYQFSFYTIPLGIWVIWFSLR